MPWPVHPRLFEETTSHEEGCIRRWNVMTKKLVGRDGRVAGLEAVEVDWSEPDEDGQRQMRERPGSGFTLAVDLVILALGFTGAAQSGLLEELGVETDERGMVKTDSGHRTTAPGVFCAGDMEVGPSHVVRAFATGRGAAESIDRMLSEK